MYRLIYLLLVLLIPQVLAAQVQWGHQIGNRNSAEEVEQHVVDREGNIVAVGYFEGTVTIGNSTLTSTDLSDTFIYKATPSGQILWAKALNGPGYGGNAAVSTDNAGNIYISSNFVRELVLDGSTIISGHNSQHTFVCKLDKDGNLIWVKGILGDNPTSDVRVLRVVSANAKGEVVIALNFLGAVNLEGDLIYNNTASGSSLLIAKYSTNGTLDWYTVPPTGLYAEAVDAQIDEEGNVLITGFYTGTITFGSTRLTATTSEYGDIYVAKFDDRGNSLWAKSFNKAAPAELSNKGKALEVDPITKEVYLAGDFKGSVYFDGVRLDGVNNRETGEISDIFLTKLSENGVVIWAKRLGTSEYDIVYDLHLQNDEVVMAGVWNYDPFFRTFDRDGKEGKEFIMDVSEYGVARSVTSRGNDEYLLSGFFFGDFQNGPGNWTTGTGRGAAFLLKINFGCLTSSPLTKPVLSYTCSQITIENHDGVAGITWYKDEVEIPSQTSVTFTSPQDGNYIVKFQTSCDTTFSESLAFRGSQFLPPAPEMTSDCRKIVVQNQGNNQIIWYRDGKVLTGAQHAELLLSGRGEYKAQFDNGCGVSSATLVIDNYIPAQGLTHYNVITPNGDNMNEYFVLDPALTGASLQVYNRWGHKVYDNKNYQNDWNGQGLSPAVYYWFLSDKCAGDLKGTVTILR